MYCHNIALDARPSCHLGRTQISFKASAHCVQHAVWIFIRPAVGKRCVHNVLMNPPLVFCNSAQREGFSFLFAAVLVSTATSQTFQTAHSHCQTHEKKPTIGPRMFCCEVMASQMIPPHTYCIFCGPMVRYHQGIMNVSVSVRCFHTEWV